MTHTDMTISLALDRPLWTDNAQERVAKRRSKRVQRRQERREARVYFSAAAIGR